MEKVIYLEADEEITSVIDRIKNVSEGKIALVLPKRANLLQSIVSLKLLKRQIDALGKEVAIVTTDKLGRNLASQVGFMVYQKLGEQPVEVEPKPGIQKPLGAAIGYRTGKEIPKKEPQFQTGPSIADITYRKEPPKEPPKESPEEDVSPLKTAPISTSAKPHHEETHKAITKSISKPLPKKTRGLSSKNIMIILILSIIAVLLAALICFFILPKAKVTIVLKGNVTQASFDATISKNTNSPNFDKSILPGNNITLEKEATQKDLPCTGKKNIGQKATGTIIISNSFDTNPQSLVANTRFVASNGNTYRLTAAVTVPGATVSGGNIVAGTTTATVQADEPGEDYNIASSHFTIPGFAGTSKYDKIYADTASAIKGGFTEEITVLSQDDVNINKDKMVTDLNNQIKADAQNKYKDKKVFLDGIQPEVTVTPNIPVDTESKKFDLKVKVKYNTLSSSNNDFNYLVAKKLASSLPADQELIQEGMEANKTFVSNFDKSLGVETVKVDAKGFIVTKLDKNKIKDEIAGKSQNDAINHLETLKDVTEAKVELWPIWVRSVPRLMKRNIDINVQIKH